MEIGNGQIIIRKVDFEAVLKHIANNENEKAYILLQRIEREN